MASYSYIILRNSVEQAAWAALTSEQRAAQMAWEASYGTSGSDPGFWQGKKFKVVMGGYRAALVQPLSSIVPTPAGWVDTSPGPIFYEAQFIIRTYHTIPVYEPEPHLGTLGDLETYYKLQNPNGTPTNIKVLVDHFGVEHTGFFREDFVPEPLTTTIEGAYAIFMVPISFIQQQAVA